MPISDRPWDFSQADYNPEQWRRACIVDRGTDAGDENTKQRYSVPIREPDGTLNRNGVHAAAGGHGLGQVTGISPDIRRAAARRLAAAYRELDEEPPDSVLQMAGENVSRAEPMSYERSWALDDIEILRAADGYGDGRTVEAYAAVFDTPAEVRDQYGHYIEVIARNAFDKTLRERGTRSVSVIYNHGMTLHGTPSDMWSVPIGRPLEIKPDGRGLRTISRYNMTPEADRVLESIKNGDIRAQSFRGRIYQSKPALSRTRQYRPDSRGNLTTVTRTEMGLTEYGPTPAATYEGAEILALRSLIGAVAGLSDSERGQLAHMLSSTTHDGPEMTTATSTTEAGAEEPQRHSIRQSDIARRIRSGRIARGIR